MYICGMSQEEVTTFEELGIPRHYRGVLDEQEITTASPIQARAIKPIKAGQDVIGIAPTGTGKTLAFLLPVMTLLQRPDGDWPRVIVMSPTKELALQVAHVAEGLSHAAGLRVACLHGGRGKKKQEELIAEGLDLIVCTPGRLNELAYGNQLSLKKVKHLILDEADKMMDMGFLPQLHQLLDILPRRRQNLLFSATFPDKVKVLSDDFLLSPTRIEIAPQSTPVETVKQHIFYVPNDQTKLNLLIHLLLDEEAVYRVIVFCRSKSDVTRVEAGLKAAKVMGKRAVLHANKNMNTRINAMQAFRDGEIRILITTDIAARGIDVKDVSHVINYNVPKLSEEYVHRIGRTGRMHRDGIALTFVDPSEIYNLKKIQKLIGMKIDEASIPAEVEMPMTSKEELIEQAREIDQQRRKEDPNFKGAFHQKKHPKKKKFEKEKRRSKQPQRFISNTSKKKKRN